MKKLSLKNLEFEANELLQRNQLKTVVGGYGHNCPDGTAPCTCNGVDKGCKTVQGCWDSC